MLVLEQGRLARCFAILEALRTLGIEAQHPITDRLQADATDARRIAARAAVKNLGKRQQTTGKGGILALLGEGTKLKSCKIRPKGNRHRHGKSPLFAKINHAAADLKTHNKSAFQRRGITPDMRPEQRRMRLDTVSLRGMYAQRIHGSKRSLRSIEDFTEFEQRTAYFNGDESHAIKKGMNILDRIQVSHMAQLQNMFDFPPAPKLTVTGILDPAKAAASEIAGEKLFFGKAQCSTCHPAPFYLDNQMHDLDVEQFLKNEAGDGPIKTFTLRGIKDSPPYLHDGRLLTLEDTVEFFNLVLELKLTPEEKHNLVDFMRQL